MGSVGSLFVNIGADISALKKGIAEASAALKDFGTKELAGISSPLAKNLESIGGNLAGIGSKVTAGITLPIVGGFAASVKAGMDFEKEMSAIKAVTGASSVEMKSFGDLALKMGADTKFSAKEAAQGIEELAKAGVSTSDILSGGLSGALSLAAAGDLELSEAAEIASTALNAFKADGLSVAQAADILAGAANASATDVKELMYGLSMVSAVASGAGMSFKDTATALAVFAQNGLKGSDAGTSLKTMLMNLQPATDKQIALFKKLGFMTRDGTNLFYDQQGRLKSLGDIAGLLRDKLQSLTPAQRQLALETMFGSDAVRAANILFKEGSQGIADMAGAMGKFTASDVAKEKMNNLSGSVEQLKGSLETAGITISNQTNGPVKGLVDWLTKLVNGFMQLDPPMQNSILLSLGVAAAIGPLIWIIGGLASAFAGLAAATGLATLQISLIVLGIAALVIAAIFVWQNWSKIWTAIVNFAMWAGNGIANFFKWIGSSAAGFFAWVWNSITGAVSGIWSAVSSSVSGFFGWIWGILTGWFSAISAAWQEFASKPGYYIGLGLGFVIGQAVAFFQWLGSVIQAGIQAVIQFFWNLPGAILGAMQAVWNWISQTWTNIWNWLSAVVPQIIQSVASFFAELPGRIWTWLLNTLQNIINWAGDMKSKAGEAASNVVNAIVDFFSKLPGQMLDIGKNIVRGLWDGISGLLGWLKEQAGGFVKGFADGFKKALGIRSPSKLFAGIGVNVSRGLAAGIADGAKAVYGQLDNLNARMAASVTADYSLPESAQVRGGVNIYIDGTRNVDEIMNELVRRLKYLGYA